MINSSSEKIQIIVLVKQVPATLQIKVNPNTGTLMRSGVESILNPFCEYALDMAVYLKNKIINQLQTKFDLENNKINRKWNVKNINIEIIAISMGPPQAKAALLRCLELGADKAILLSDRKFAGSDVWATSYILSYAIKKYFSNFSIILTGKQAIDGDTAQVPAEVAENLAIPQIYYVTDIKDIKLSISKLKESNNLKIKSLHIKKEIEEGYQIIEARPPLLLSISKGPWFSRRFPSLYDILMARKKTLKILKADDLEIDENNIGLNGSKTQVIKVFSPPKKEKGKIIDGSNPKNAAKLLLEFLIENGFILKRENNI
ncbi:MAG: electron transfer flavoprotein subunit beta/FixA family protein [Promethearchaeota archaeon]